ncbi:tRNA dihydrouridine synthase DusB [Miniphocaeibacter massiliensis]|uniref:tRNA dihydrouridine synthase DusB n=1 Tax=Miniphocaeibacter massiliensis TaxID=2041841 RepID=UPI001F5DDE93|nr:tRNA dihydrouridine synthase DusB [Miniphocaeibacter massiliensis]
MIEIKRKKINIGKLELDNNIFMAPLAGITDASFREIASELGSGLNFTEMVSAKGLYHSDKGTKRLLKKSKNETNLGVQIFGNDPYIMSEIIKRNFNENDDFIMIDINMGCPAPKIVKNGEGSALMKDLKLADKILRAVVKSSNKEVSVKFRLGWDEESINYVELGKIAENAGVSMVTLHPRTRKAYYSGKADWNAIKKLKEELSIPVIGNGDLNSEIAIYEMFNYTLCDGVSLARGALQNPYLFSRTNYKPKLDELIELIKKHYFLKIDLVGERIGINEMRKHVAWYLKGLRNSNELKNRINTLNTLEEIFLSLDKFKNESRRCDIVSY